MTLQHSPSQAVEAVMTASQQGMISIGAVKNLNAWLTEARYAEYLPLVLEHIDQAK